MAELSVMVRSEARVSTCPYPVTNCPYCRTVCSFRHHYNLCNSYCKLFSL